MTTYRTSDGISHDDDAPAEEMYEGTCPNHPRGHLWKWIASSERCQFCGGQKDHQDTTARNGATFEQTKALRGGSGGRFGRF